MHFGMGRWQIVSFRLTESESAPELPRKLLLRNSWNIYFPRKDRCFPEKMVSPVVEAVYNGEDYWNQGEAGNVLVTGGSSNSENGQELVYSIKVPSADKVNELKQLGKMLTTPVLDNTIITSAVCENGVRYLNGEISLDEAVNAVMQQVNLYLAE